MSKKTALPSSFSFFKGVFNFIKSSVSTMYAWFYRPSRAYPANEAGELMRRMMIPISWFDKISAQWTERSFWNRASTILSAVLTSGAIGILWGSPLIFALAASVVSVMINNRLIEHEDARFNRALTLADETIQLNQQLQVISTLHENSTRETTALAQQLHEQNTNLQTQVKRFDTEITTLQETHRQALGVHQSMTTLTVQTTSLIKQEEAIHAGCLKIQDEIRPCQLTVRQVTEQVNALGNNVIDLTTTATQFKKSAHDFSVATQRFLGPRDLRTPSTRGSWSDKLNRMKEITALAARENDVRDNEIKHIICN